jgi:hypothetical protein
MPCHVGWRTFAFKCNKTDYACLPLCAFYVFYVFYVWCVCVCVCVCACVWNVFGVHFQLPGIHVAEDYAYFSCCKPPDNIGDSSHSCSMNIRASVCECVFVRACVSVCLCERV